MDENNESASMLETNTGGAVSHMKEEQPLACPLCGHTAAASSIQNLFELPYRKARALVLRAFEFGFLYRLIRGERGNVSAAARRANMDRSYLIKLLKRHGLP